MTSKTMTTPEVLEPFVEPARKIDGPMSAVMIAAGIGAFVLGLLTTLAEANADVKDWLILDDDVGPLSGKTVYATIAFCISWVILYFLMRKKDGVLRNATIVFIVLTALGYLGTFPIFFQAFAD